MVTTRVVIARCSIKGGCRPNRRARTTAVVSERHRETQRGRGTEDRDRATEKEKEKEKEPEPEPGADACQEHENVIAFLADADADATLARVWDRWVREHAGAVVVSGAATVHLVRHPPPAAGDGAQAAGPRVAVLRTLQGAGAA